MLTIERKEKNSGKALKPPENRIIVEKRPDGRLWTTRNGQAVAVRVQPCFPWSYPKKYLSLRDDQNNEVALIHELDELDNQSRQIVEHALAEAAFVLEIQAVFAQNEEFEVRTWDVDTKQGRRKFQTKRDTWPVLLSGGGLLIRDIAGDLFYIENPNELDQQSRKLLAPFVD